MADNIIKTHNLGHMEYLARVAEELNDDKSIHTQWAMFNVYDEPQGRFGTIFQPTFEDPLRGSDPLYSCAIVVGREEATGELVWARKEGDLVDVLDFVVTEMRTPYPEGVINAFQV